MLTATDKDRFYIFMKKILILVGPPGSGKGTQAKKIAEKYNYGHISTGDLLRNLASQGSVDPEEEKALEEMKKGGLVPSWLIYRLGFRQIDKYIKKGQGVVLDGAIRSVEQADKYQEHFKEKGLLDEVMVIEVALTDEESFNRLTKRRVCEDCGELIPWLESTKDLTTCPKCNGKLIIRKDDDEDVIKNRINKQGNSALEPIVSYYKDLDIYNNIDGSSTIQEVESAIDAMLKG